MVPSPILVEVVELVVRPMVIEPRLIVPVPFTVIVEVPLATPEPYSKVPVELNVPPLTLIVLFEPAIQVCPLLVTVPPERLKVLLPPALSPMKKPVVVRMPAPLTLTVPVCPEALVI